MSSLLHLLSLIIILLTATSTASLVLGDIYQHHAQQPVPGQKPQIGNGFIAAFVNHSSEFVAGIYSGSFTESTGPAFPASTYVFLEHCGYERFIPYEKVLASGNATPFELDFEKATVSLSGNNCTVSSSSSASFDFYQRWYAPRTRKEVIATEIFIENVSLASTFELSIIDTPIPPPASYDNNIEIVNTTLEIINNQLVNITVYTTTEPETSSSSLELVAAARVVPPKSITIHQQKSPSSSPALRVFATYLTSWQYPNDTALELASRVKSLFTENSNAFESNNNEAGAVYTNHTKAWSSLWSHSFRTDSPSVNPPVRASQYAMMCSLNAEVPFSTSPGGLPSTTQKSSYRSHKFWDEELWVGPNFALTHPDIVRNSILKYRLDRLKGAMINAKETIGVVVPQDSAAFPWESAQTGTNVCPAPIFAHTEIHVTADVVLAIRNFYWLTRDKEFLREAWDVLNATARYWVGKTTVLQVENTSDFVHLNNVTPPDEYAIFSNDSVYTNYAVREAVGFTLEAAQELSIPNSTIEYFAEMKQISEKLVLLFDPDLNYHPEFSNYTLPTPIKQADVALLNYPLQMPRLRNTTLKNDLDFYENVTSPNDSGANTMTYSIYSIGYFSLGDVQKGVANFFRGVVENCMPPFYQWYQAVGAKGSANFISGAGGFVQSFWAGYGGLRVTREGLSISQDFLEIPSDGSYIYMLGLNYLRSVFNIQVYRNILGGANHFTFELVMTQAPLIEGPKLCLLDVIETEELLLLVNSNSSSNSNDDQEKIRFGGGMLERIDYDLQIIKKIDLWHQSTVIIQFHKFRTTPVVFPQNPNQTTVTYQRNYFWIRPCDEQPSSPSPSSPSPSSPQHHNPSSPDDSDWEVPVGVVGGLMVLMIGGVVIIVVRKRNRQQQEEHDTTSRYGGGVRTNNTLDMNYNDIDHESDERHPIV